MFVVCLPNEPPEIGHSPTSEAANSLGDALDLAAGHAIGDKRRPRTVLVVEHDDDTGDQTQRVWSVQYTPGEASVVDDEIVRGPGRLAIVHDGREAEVVYHDDGRVETRPQIGPHELVDARQVPA
jgi:hypothetical protein